MLPRLQGHGPLRQARAMHEAMEARPEDRALLQGHKDHQGFPHEPQRMHVEEGHGRLVRLVDVAPMIRDQQRPGGVCKQ